MLGEWSLEKKIQTIFSAKKRQITMENVQRPCVLNTVIYFVNCKLFARAGSFYKSFYNDNQVVTENDWYEFVQLPAPFIIGGHKSVNL